MPDYQLSEYRREHILRSLTELKSIASVLPQQLLDSEAKEGQRRVIANANQSIHLLLECKPIHNWEDKEADVQS